MNFAHKQDPLSLIKINHEKYEKEKKERHERFLQLQQERQQILDQREKILNRLQTDKTIQFSLSRQSNISTNAAVNRARDKIPIYEKRIRDNIDSNAVRKRVLAHPYRGELGIGSYEPWQLEDFYFIREFLQSWIGEVLDFIIIDPDFNDNLSRTADEWQQQLHEEQEELQFSKCVREVQSDIIAETCDELACEVVDESLMIHEQTKQVVSSMILNAVLHDDDNDNVMTLVNNAYNQMKKERQRHPNLWHHSQKFENLGQETIETVETEDTFDGQTLSFDGITIINTIPDHSLSKEFKNYRLLESKFWSGNHPTMSNLPLPKRYKGVSCAALTSNHSLLAIGTLQGDIAVWNLMVYPPRVLAGCKGNLSITQIQWSLDSSQIVSVNQRGNVQLWTISKGGSTVDMKAFEPVENDGFQPAQFTCRLTLEPKDFLFTQGNLASAKTVISKPTFAKFHPSLTFLGRQECLLIGLLSGNILKLNLGKGNSSTQRFNDTNNVNLIGKGIEAELFKAHHHPIRHISFVDNISQMVTVDDEGYINLWDYSDESLSGYGWFTPTSCYHLDMTQKTYKPAEGSTEKIEFTDVVKGTGRVKELNRQDMIVKRKQMQTFINSLHLGKPWRTIPVGSQKVNHLYAPRGVPESGATFHSVTFYRENKLLAQYSTQLYRTITVKATKIASCKVSPLGNKLVIALLFDEVPPKPPHVIFVTIDLPSMKVLNNLNEVTLSIADYKQCQVDECCDFDISKQIDATGSPYMFTNVCGTVGSFSMITTNLVMASRQRGWTGCGLNDEQSTVFSMARVIVACQDNGLCVVFYSPKINNITLLHIKDNNSMENRLKVWQAFCVLRQSKQGAHPRECLRRHHWVLNGEHSCHLKCSMETLVLDLVDQAIKQSIGQTSVDDVQDSDQSFENRLRPFIRYANQGNVDLPAGRSDSD